MGKVLESIKMVPNMRYLINHLKKYKQGGFKFDKKEGHGKYVWPDLSIYEGEFKNDLMDGEGVMEW